MLISTKGRYAVRILADVAKYGCGGVVPLKEIAVRQDISLKYIERIMSSLKEANLVESVHGTLGGDKLTKETEKDNTRRCGRRPCSRGVFAKRQRAVQAKRGV